MNRQRSRPLSRRHLIAGGAGAVGAAGLGIAMAPTVGAAGGGPTPGQLVVLPTPVRLFDSRQPGGILGGDKLADGGSVAVIAAVPDADFLAAVFVNVTVTQTEGAGYLAVRAHDTRDGVAPPATSNINWATTDVTLANLALSQVGVESSIEIHCIGPGSATHVIVDLQGYVPSAFPKDHGDPKKQPEGDTTKHHSKDVDDGK